MPCPSILASMGFIFIIPLVMLNLSIWLSPSRITPKLTFVPSSPLILEDASAVVRPFASSPSISTILSPGFIPASSAGVPSSTDTTVMIFSLVVITMPIPPKLPLVFSLKALKLSGVKYSEYGSSSDSTMPLTAPFKRFKSFTSFT